MSAWLIDQRKWRLDIISNMAYVEDNTAVIRMKRDFEQFAQDHNDSRVPAFRFHDLEDDTLNMQASNETNVISVQSLLGILQTQFYN